MIAMKNKIKSQKGASITFALLLFLVCAVISSIVIVAATAVGGRASQMAELDQRYYAVNSAAELLRDVLEQQTVTVTTGTKTVSTVQTVKGIETVTPGTPVPITPIITVKNDPVDIDASSDASSFLVAAARNLVGLSTEFNSLTLTATGPGITDASVSNVVMVPSPIVDRKLSIKVSNDNTSGKGTYTLELTFKADIVQNSNTRTSYGTPVPVVESGKVVDDAFTKEKTVEDTMVSTITWKLIDLKTDASATPTEDP